MRFFLQWAGSRGRGSATGTPMHESFMPTVIVEFKNLSPDTHRGGATRRGGNVSAALHPAAQRRWALRMAWPLLPSLEAELLEARLRSLEQALRAGQQHKGKDHAARGLVRSNCLALFRKEKPSGLRL